MVGQLLMIHTFATMPVAVPVMARMVSVPGVALPVYVKLP